MDITKSIEPKSDQQNYDDYLVGPRTVTVAEARVVKGEQPVELHLVEFPGRPFKPGKSMRRVLIACWGAESNAYAGRRMTLYGDPTVKWAGQEVGGIRISALSNIGEPKSIHLTVTRGKRAPFTVQPLPDDIGEHLAALTGAETLEALQAVWQNVMSAGFSKLPQLIELKDARKRQLTPTPELSEVELAIFEHFDAADELPEIANRADAGGGSLDPSHPDYVAADGE